MDINYKLKLILVYLNTVNEKYTYKEMTEFMGLDYNVIDELINQIEKEELIFKDEYCIINISDKGKKILEENNLLDLNFYELYNQYEIDDKLKSKSINIEDVYIPKNFKVYFKGYK
ncbi:MAG: hypothetical protein ACRCW0_07950 [Clostridium sp.]